MPRRRWSSMIDVNERYPIPVGFVGQGRAINQDVDLEPRVSSIHVLAFCLIKSAYCSSYLKA